MTEQLHRHYYNTGIDSTTGYTEALAQFENWIEYTYGIEPAPRSSWERDRKYTAAVTRRYGDSGGVKATFFYDNARANGTLYFFGEDRTEKWLAGDDGHASAPIIRITPEEMARRREAEQRERAETDAENARIWQDDVNAYLTDSTPITTASTAAGAEYLRRKQVQPTPALRLMAHERRVVFRDGVVQSFPAGSLIIPLFDVLTGELAAFQWITAASGKDNKKFRKGRRLNQIVHWIGSTCGADVLALAEGYATAYTFHHLTGITTGSTCDAGQLKKTAAALLACPHFGGKLIIAADDDFIKATEAGKWNTGKRAASEIKGLAPRRVYILTPPFNRHAVMRSELAAGKPSDWNDFYTLFGDAAARPVTAALVKTALDFFRGDDNDGANEQ